MRILLAIETLIPGGAEKFVVRMANALAVRGHQVVLYVLYGDRCDPNLIKEIHPEVEQVFLTLKFDKLIQKADSGYFRLGIPFKYRDQCVIRHLSKVLYERKIEIVHSHLFNVDYIAAKAAKALKIPVLSTVHGDYLNFDHRIKNGEKVYANLNFYSKLNFNLKHIETYVCISELQLLFFKELGEEKDFSVNLKKIYNGLDLPIFEPIQREALGIGATDFVFGMVARGIPEKGWLYALKAFRKLNNPNTHLILVGDSDYLRALEQEWGASSQIHFLGFVSHPVAWIDMFDVGLLPSTYGSESLPTSIIEYLSLSKPVIASDVGEIRKMLETLEGMAGALVPLNSGKISINDLSDKMREMMKENKYDFCKIAANNAFGKFDMNKCVDSYEQQYAELLNKA